MFGDQRVSHLISATVGGSFFLTTTFRSSLDVLYDGRLQSFPFFFHLFVCAAVREGERKKKADASPLWAWPLSDCFPLRAMALGLWYAF